jgi:hypothetical protein
VTSAPSSSNGSPSPCFAAAAVAAVVPGAATAAGVAAAVAGAASPARGSILSIVTYEIDSSLVKW